MLRMVAPLFFGSLLWLGLVLTIAGCGPSDFPEQKAREERLERERMNALPPETKVVEKKADRWWVVEIDGNVYLANYQYHGHTHNWVLTPYKQRF